MTLEEFQQRIQTVSDRRLQRMLEKARVSGPDEAVLVLEKEKERRSPPPTPLAVLDLSSQIRPLEEVLGQGFDFHERPAKPATYAPTSREIVGPAKENSGKTESFTWQPVATDAPSLQLLRDVLAAPSSEPLPDPSFASTIPDPGVPTVPTREAVQASPLAQAEEAPELMAPLVLTLPEKAVEVQPFEPKSLSRSAPGDRGRAFAVIAIVLLVVAAGLAVWRALVG